MADLFSNPAGKKAVESYSAKDIEVLEGLEPVRLRPGMYIGGTDEVAMHHLATEVFDNSMDEAVAGHANWIEVHLAKDGSLMVRDNGRGIPIDPHPKYPKKSALEVILTMLHSGGKFSGKAYETSGGLHGVGISVVNALSDHLRVEIVRDKILYSQEFSRGEPMTKLIKEGNAPNRRGTTVTFHPDPEIFGKIMLKAARVYQLCKSKAYLYRGVEIRWSCDPEMVPSSGAVPQSETIHFPNGLVDFLNESLHGQQTVMPEPFSGEAKLADNKGRVEWAIAWPMMIDGFTHSYCNTIVTPQGGTHEQGLRAAISKAIKEYSELVNNKKAAVISSEDIMLNGTFILSTFYKDPQFQGQTKDKLVTTEVARLVENAIRDHFDHYLSKNTQASTKLLEFLIDRAEERLARRQQKETSRKNVIQKLRLPGKLADCTRNTPEGTELFLVEGDSAGGSAKQARNRETQAILPLRGKILNIANATADKIRNNQEIADMLTALGCGSGSLYDESALRYEKIIIMTDADVDGAHIASLLMTYFFLAMPKLIENGHLFLAQPPLYRITQGARTVYAQDDAEKAKILGELSKRGHVEVGRFKGLGEMTAPQLKETTMNPELRTLLRVAIEEHEIVATHVEHLMGKKPELRFKFIEEQSKLKRAILENTLDI
jgi:topoisomerase-4 subunit B